MGLNSIIHSFIHSFTPAVSQSAPSYNTSILSTSCALGSGPFSVVLSESSILSETPCFHLVNRLALDCWKPCCRSHLALHPQDCSWEPNFLLPFRPHVSYQDFKTPLQQFFLQEALLDPLRLGYLSSLCCFPEIRSLPWPAHRPTWHGPASRSHGELLRAQEHGAFISVSSRLRQGPGTWRTQERHVTCDSGLGPRAETRGGALTTWDKWTHPRQLGCGVGRGVMDSYQEKEMLREWKEEKKLARDRGWEGKSRCKGQEEALMTPERLQMDCGQETSEVLSGPFPPGVERPWGIRS